MASQDKNNKNSNNNKKSKNNIGSVTDKLGSMNVKVGKPSFNIQEYIRVLKLARKPSRDEFMMISKISVLGIALIGMLGFIIYVLLTVVPESFA